MVLCNFVIFNNSAIEMSDNVQRSKAGRLDGVVGVATRRLA